MIWPGRAPGVALLVPALLSLALFVTEAVGPAVIALDVAIGRRGAGRPGHADRRRAGSAPSGGAGRSRRWASRRRSS